VRQVLQADPVDKGARLSVINHEQTNSGGEEGFNVMLLEFLTSGGISMFMPPLERYGYFLKSHMR